jgi:hypothetical protein
MGDWNGIEKWLNEKAHPLLIPYIAFMLTLEFIVIVVKL